MSRRPFFTLGDVAMIAAALLILALTATLLCLIAAAVQLP